MRILVVGAGATGGYFGGRLAQAGRDVTFLVREKRAQALKKTGLYLHTAEGISKVEPKLLVAADLKESFDLIILTVKGFSLTAVLDEFAPAVGEQTLILPVLNGMRHLQIIEDRFGKQAVIGGLCRINATLDAEGQVHQMTPLHQLTYGEVSGERSARIIKLDETLQHAGFEARLSDDIISEMWEKWLFLSSLGGITCLMRGNIGQVAQAPGGEGFAKAFIQEVLSAIVAGGYQERPQATAHAIKELTNKASVQTSSMYRDMMQGFAVEAEQILGDLVTLSANAGLSTPLIDAAFTHMSVYQQQREKTLAGQ
ncbi:ketopantoate reductase family protein [Rahnella sp. SAP-1]|uniref:2-dehydropantoate 2-reductase n=1 Tax=Rouxiella aceris TaxID=2703884 RepID=A0A848MMM8_9GAMM|nr:ketopantoate reductase family protein [Rouxiella aceris]NMP28341.1 ketopantoate reductase family protein [Rouxiella aceris]